MPIIKHLSPREANSEKKILQLKEDNIDSKSHWMIIEPHRIVIAKQFSGGELQEKVSIDRRSFNRFVDWYNEKQTKLIK